MLGVSGLGGPSSQILGVEGRKTTQSMEVGT